MHYKSIIKSLLMIIFAVALVSSMVTIPASASESKTSISGKVYSFGEKSKYEFSSAETYSTTNYSNTYGELSISGAFDKTSTKNGVPSYKVNIKDDLNDNNLMFIYKYDDKILNAEEEAWHLIDDKSKNIDSLSLQKDIMKGAIVIQTSKDKTNWVTVKESENVFADKPVNNESIYSATNMQLINGCYYRVIVAYEMRQKTGTSNFLFITSNDYDFIKRVEVYEFYAFTDSVDMKAPDPSQCYNIGSRVRCKQFDGYYGEETIAKGDQHYGWELGSFFVSGYTSKTINSDKETVFLKNVGDKVTLWFNLKQNIDALDGKKDIKITADKEGYDQYFETPKTDFGRGTLIVRYTDYNNVRTEPQIYTNYLEAVASVDADTKVQLFDEGDYEVALDYQVTKDELFDKIGHYRIFFKFQVRNSDSNFFLFDTSTNKELNNGAMTTNGFRLDLAKSRYLTVNLKREILKDSADGLIEDTKFNGAARDGNTYTKEGIYTITAINPYTNAEPTKKRIYVGNNKILRAHMATGKTISEINQLVADGATIDEFGDITLPVKETEPVQTTAEPVQPVEETTTTTAVPAVEVINTTVIESSDITTEEPVSEEADKETEKEKENNGSSLPLIIIIIIAIVAVGAFYCGFMLPKIKKKDDNTSDNGGETQ